MRKNKNKVMSVQEWIPFNLILKNGIIKTKENKYIKIIKINPINFNLKSNLEKESILNSYKIFLKTINSDIQILIQSNKEDLSYHISKIKKQIIKENNKKLKNISNQYINYIQELNKKKKSSNKNFYILIKSSQKENIENNNESIILEQLNETYFKIKEGLARCGNIVYEINEKEEVINILFSFLNYKKYLTL